MCGIVGLFLKDPKLEPCLGALLADMLGTLCDRGPDSAGFAVYGLDAPVGNVKLTLRTLPDVDIGGLMEQLERVAGTPLPHHVRDTHVVLTVPATGEATIRAELASIPGISVVGAGRRMEIFKEVAKRFPQGVFGYLAQARLKSAAGDFAGALNDAKQAQAAAPSDAQKQAIKGLIDRLEAKQDINK